jgi:hypothetical protein
LGEGGACDGGCIDRRRGVAIIEITIYFDIPVFVVVSAPVGDFLLDQRVPKEVIRDRIPAGLESTRERGQASGPLK